MQPFSMRSCESTATIERKPDKILLARDPPSTPHPNELFIPPPLRARLCGGKIQSRCTVGSQPTSIFSRLYIGQLMTKWHDHDKRIAADKQADVADTAAHDLVIRATDVQIRGI
jgi:hypothetical protein